MVPSSMKRLPSRSSLFQQSADVVDLGGRVKRPFQDVRFAVRDWHSFLPSRVGHYWRPRGIGRSVAKAVVNSIVLILILDYFLTRFCYILKMIDDSNQPSTSQCQHSSPWAAQKLRRPAVLKGRLRSPARRDLRHYGSQRSGKSVLSTHHGLEIG